MAKLPEIYYSLLLVVLITALTGCALPRDGGDASEPDPVSGLPTLAPLGSESTELTGEATAIPTVINVQPTATSSSVEGEIPPDPAEPVIPTSQPASISASPAADNSQTIEETAVEPETFTPPAAESAAGESIVVDATTEDLPAAGPIAVDPPASQTTGDYTAATLDGAVYTVQPGDTLYSIGLHYGTTAEAILYANNLSSDLIYVGQELIISASDSSYYPSPTYENSTPSGGDAYHVVAPGESLFRVALTYNTSVDAIAGANGIPYPYIIQVGQQLAIPAYGSNPGPPPPPEGGFFQPDPGLAPSEQGFAPPEPGIGLDNSFAAPGIAGTHPVAPGETLFSISQYYGIPAQAIAEANGLSDPNQIYVGQVLYLP